MWWKFVNLNMYKLIPMFLFAFGFAETVEVYYTTDTPIAGFTISTGNNTVLGFSLTGGIIPAGNYTIMYLDFIGDVSTICLSHIIVSDPMGNAIDYEIGECWVQ